MSRGCLIDERHNYLLDADLGVSTHFDHVETTFSFRTRILDYLWAGLPIVATVGDSFAELIDEEALGAAVPERDVESLAAAMESLLFDENAAEAARANVQRVRERFVWERTLAPLVEFCRNPVRAADKPALDAPPSRKATSLGTAAGRKRSSNHSGFRRDLDRVGYYLKSGGLSVVWERYRARRARMREAERGA